MKRFVCIHGHFYQPPRENPWLEDIEFQDSAQPYDNWNDRISAECYAPNTASRILDTKDNIIDIVNNYSKISFNFGPTLLSWMEKADPETYALILNADKLSQERFSGHGAALAQAYNHMIMPLANARDKHTQVLWGLKDFESRFKRKPEGMWLPETAVDIDTLEELAAAGIRFTILAPRQAKRVRKIGEKLWRTVHENTIDPQMPYLCNLPSGRQIVIFFYDGPISQDIAFSGLLRNGENFAHRLAGAFPKDHQHDSRLVSVATDGETYGHHHRFGNMALSYCLYAIEEKNMADLTIYGEYLDNHAPHQEVEIVENSSWSCVHGVERWRKNCGCCIGTHPLWNQEWRTPLRETLDWLRDLLAPLYEKTMGQYVADPWHVRDAYIDVVLNRSRSHVELFLKQHAAKDLSPDEKVTVLKLLEIQRHAMLMYTSCGWFFDDFWGIETTQIIQYAARAVQLAKDAFGLDLEAEFLERLFKATSNLIDYQDGPATYAKKVKPSVIDHLDVVAHYAINQLFTVFPDVMQVYSFIVIRQELNEYEVGKQKLLIGWAEIRSDITLETHLVDFMVLHVGEYSFSAATRIHQGADSFRAMEKPIKDAFVKNKISDAIRLMSQHFTRHDYSLWNLFKNEQHKVLDCIFSKTVKAVDEEFRHIYDQFHPLLEINQDIRFPLPKSLAMIVEFTLNSDITQTLDSDPIDFMRLTELIKENKRWAFARDRDALSFAASRRITGLVNKFAKDTQDWQVLVTIQNILKILNSLPLVLDLWRAQNIFFALTKTVYPDQSKKSESGDASARMWVQYFDNVSQALKVHVVKGADVVEAR